jgi:hypothetical protein
MEDGDGWIVSGPLVQATISVERAAVALDGESTFQVTWTPELPALRHKVETTTVQAVSREAATLAVANAYPAPILVQRVEEVIAE